MKLSVFGRNPKKENPLFDVRELCQGGGWDKRGFLGAKRNTVVKPKLEALGIWALLFRQMGLALASLTEGGNMIFRFSWVLSVYDAEVEPCDFGLDHSDRQLRLITAEAGGLPPPRPLAKSVGGLHSPTSLNGRSSASMPHKCRQVGEQYYYCLPKI